MDPAPVDVLPPPDRSAVVRLAGSGAGIVAAAGGIGLVADLAFGGGSDPVRTVRLLLTAWGVVTAGVAVARRPDVWLTWAWLAAACALAGLLAVPPHWDSARLLGKMAAGVAAAFAVAQALPAGLRPVGAALAIAFHFGGILAATTWPHPTPWLTQQAMVRAFAPYLTAVYLRNAYHFYSPEPGPASLLYVLVKYEVDGEPGPVSAWEYFPTRERHMKDPMGLSYYRRLSLTEASSQSLGDATTADTFNRTEAQIARQKVAIAGFSRPGPDGKPEQVVVPVAPYEFESPAGQYRVPEPMVTRYLLPSYARHLAASLSAPGRKVVGLKVYRLEHRVVQPHQFIGAGGQPAIGPYHPTTYRPYFLGDYTPAGELLDPRDPLLYWLIPVLPKPGGAAPGDKKKVDFDDYLSRHAGFEVDWPHADR